MLDQILALDRFLLLAVNNGLAGDRLDHIMTFLSSPLPWFLGVFGVLGYLGYRRKWPGIWLLFQCVVLIGLLDAFNYYVLKEYFGRIRPCKTLEAVRIVKGCAGQMSFPSNHATNSMGAALLAFYYGPRFLGFSAIILAVLIGFSRIYLGVHYPFDILAGFFVGALWAICFVKGRQKLVKSKISGDIE